MPFCFKCGTWADDGASFCPVCGAAVNSSDSNAHVKPEPRVWQVFARLGKIFSLIGFIGSFTPIICFITLGVCIPGIVFSALGKKSTLYYGTASRSLALAIAGTVISFVWGFLSIFLISEALT